MKKPSFGEADELFSLSEASVGVWTQTFTVQLDLSGADSAEKAGCTIYSIADTSSWRFEPPADWGEQTNIRFSWTVV